MSKSVAVCVKKGYDKLGKETLQWLEEQTDVPEVGISRHRLKYFFQAS